MREFQLSLPDGLGIVGSVDDDHVLSFVVIAGSSSPIRGTEMFDLMMRAIGNEARAIAGVWRRGFEGKPSTNMEKLNALTALGLPLDQAVYQTWTATRAARWGFNRVTIDGEPEGSAGQYVKVNVLIERAGTQHE